MKMINLEAGMPTAQAAMNTLNNRLLNDTPKMVYCSTYLCRQSRIFLTIKNQKKKTGHLSGLYTLGTSSALVAFSGKLVVSCVLLNHLNPYTPCVY